jgi:large subunit ribosomal protein L24
LQTTLLGFAIAIIVALVAALVGPLVIDWGGYRSIVEREASRLSGIEVHVTGPIDARLLPSPRLTLQDVEIGGSDAEPLRARSLNVEFALGPLLRGEWRASEMTLSGPQLHVGLDKSGKLTAPGVSLKFDPDAISIDRLSIEDGTVVLGDAASGTVLKLDNVWFNGELRSLAGPLKGEGAATIGGAQFPYRISLSRVSDEGTSRLRLNIDPTNYPLSIEADGTVSVKAGDPHFDGTLNLARPVGIASAGADALVTQPWRLGGKIKVSAASALMELLEFQYGSEQQGVKLSGTAEFKFGREPRFDGVLSGRQIDLDQVAGESESGRPPPAATLRRLAGIAASAFRPSFPIAVGIGIDQVTLGGGTIQNVRGDISTSANGWTLDRFEFRAPGYTQVRLSGGLAVDANGVNFTGPADIAASDANALTGWLEGRADPQTPSGRARSLRLRGDITLGSEKIAVEHLNAAFDREAISGRFAYTFAAAGKGARLEAALNAPELDIDAATGFANAILAGSAAERPSEADVAIDIDRATTAGIEARKASARLRFDAGRLEITRLSIGDLGGAAISASGQAALVPAPRGDITLDLNAADLTAVTTVLGKSIPSFAGALSRAAPILAPAKLRATLKLDGDGSNNRATFAIDGTGGKIQIALKGQADAELSALNAATVRVQSRLESTDASVLSRLLGLDGVAAVGKEPGVMTLTANGPALGELQVVGGFTSPTLAASATGSLRALDPAGPDGTLSINVERADLRSLFGGGNANALALPVALTARLALSPGQMKFDELSAVVAATKIRGDMTLGLDTPHRIAGELSADTIDIGALVAAGIGVPAGFSASAPGNWTWPSDPIDGGAAGDFNGRVDLKAARAGLLPGVEVREFRSGLSFTGGGIALDDLSAQWAGGSVSGRMSLQPGGDGVAMKLQLGLKDVDATAFFSGATRAPVSGKANVDLQLEGSGRSPGALVGALRGTGKASLDNGEFAALDPRAFDTVVRAVDKGMAVDSAKVSVLAGHALDSGQLAVKHAQADLTVDAGQMRLSNASVKGDGADASLSGGVDLTTGAMDLRLVLTGNGDIAGVRPDIFLSLRGPLLAPARNIDVSALSGWLTMRAVERQSRRLEQLEKAQQAAPAPAVVAPPLPSSQEIAPRPKPAAPRALNAAPLNLAPTLKRQSAPAVSPN